MCVSRGYNTPFDRIQVDHQLEHYMTLLVGNLFFSELSKFIMPVLYEIGQCYVLLCAYPVDQTSKQLGVLNYCDIYTGNNFYIFRMQHYKTFQHFGGGNESCVQYESTTSKCANRLSLMWNFAHDIAKIHIAAQKTARIHTHTWFKPPIYNQRLCWVVQWHQESVMIKKRTKSYCANLEQKMFNGR